MGRNIYYIEIEERNISSRHFPRISTRRKSYATSKSNILLKTCSTSALATCWELLFSTFCSIITTAYTVHHERRNVSSPTQLLLPPNALERVILEPDSGHFSFILDPPPAFMLACCLTLGISISSFCYRRQGADRFQGPIFIAAIACSSVFGVAMGVHPNLIMLGLIPWALCAAMVFSATVHCLVRRCGRRTSVFVCRLDEKEGLLRN